jgi:hypothetical protein
MYCRRPLVHVLPRPRFAPLSPAAISASPQPPFMAPSNLASRNPARQSRGALARSLRGPPKLAIPRASRPRRSTFHRVLGSRGNLPPPERCHPEPAPAAIVASGRRADPLSIEFQKPRPPIPSRVEAERFLRAVDDLCRLAPASPASVGSPRRASSAGGACTVVEVAMTRLEDEFCHVLSARALDLEIEALSSLSSLSMASDWSNSDATEAAAGEEDDGSVSSSVGRRSSYRSLQSIREIDLFPVDAISDLHTKVRSARACHPSPIMRSDIILFLKEGSQLKAWWLHHCIHERMAPGPCHAFKRPSDCHCRCNCFKVDDRTLHPNASKLQ